MALWELLKKVLSIFQLKSSSKAIKILL